MSRLCALWIPLFVVQIVHGKLDPAHVDAVTAVISNYQRPFTLLEIGEQSSIYLAELPYQKRLIGELVSIGGDADALIRQVQPIYKTSVSIMVPPQLSLDMLDILSRCEHFDVVIVHDLSEYFTLPAQRIIATLTSLGDYVFMCAESEVFEKALQRNTRISCVAKALSTGPSMYLSSIPKTGLDLARFTQMKSPASKRRYEVHSTFNHKEFYKEGLPYPLRWVHGINLVTFCMLYGVYPGDDVLRKELLRLRKTCDDHNDIVLGNCILQGCRLFPIDTKDTRRNADPYNLLNAGLRAFKRGNTRMHNPQAWIDNYYNAVQA